VTGRTEPVSDHGLLLRLRRDSSLALHEQLEQRLRADIRSRRLHPGTRLPSSRALATTLGVSRGVVLEAYSQLVAEGYLVASQGAPTRVADAPSAERAPLPAGSLQRGYRVSFDPGVPDLASFPRAVWLRSMRAALNHAPFAALGRGDPRGLPRLRDELMGYLSRVRAAAPEPEHTIVCAGFTQGFALLCRTLRDRGLEQIAVEDPGWLGHRLIAERAGLHPIPIPVDEHGISIPALSGSDCEAVVITPAHQFPTGVVLDSERRTGLLEWAEERDAVIVEDDYDSELRLDREAVGALQGLTPERVCHIGSFSQRLAPGLALGWILSPSWLTGALTYEKATADGATSVVEQLALADFLARGGLERHLRRMRLAYRERRRALVTLLAESIPAARVSGVPAGVFALVELPAEIVEERLVATAAAEGVLVIGLGTHRTETERGPGLVLGYGNLSRASLRHGVEALARCAYCSHGGSVAPATSIPLTSAEGACENLE